MWWPIDNGLSLENVCGRALPAFNCLSKDPHTPPSTLSTFVLLLVDRVDYGYLMYGVQLIAIFASFSNHTELKQARNNTAHLPFVSVESGNNIRLCATRELFYIVEILVLNWTQSLSFCFAGAPYNGLPLVVFTSDTCHVLSPTGPIVDPRDKTSEKLNQPKRSTRCSRWPHTAVER